MPRDVVTRSFNNQRDGANLFETEMTIARLQRQGIRLKYEIKLDDDARGCEAQPLVCYGLTMCDGMKHDVLFLVSMGGGVQARDLNTGRLIWHKRVANSAKSTKKTDMWEINDGFGPMSTPVINRRTNTLYLVAMTSLTRAVDDAHFILHALDLASGSNQVPPLDLNDAVYKTPEGKKKFRLGDVPRKQRPGLLFDSRNGTDTVFVAFGSFFESADSNKGWVVAVDVTGMADQDRRPAPSIAAAWVTTANGSGGGIWMAGQGLSMDADGALFGMNGNGDFDGDGDFCESIFKVRFAARSNGATAQLKLDQWFTPFIDELREKGEKKPRPAGVLPSNFRDADDQDLGSGGPLLLLKGMTGFSKNIVAGAGKDGILYVVNADNMGCPKPEDFAPERIREHVYNKLLVPPYGFTFDGSGMDLAPLDVGDLQTFVGGYTVHQHSTPVAFMSPDHGLILYTNGENGPVRAFQLWEKGGKFGITYLGSSAEIASEGMKPPGGMPGGMMTLSANGKQDGILWVTQPIGGDANRDIVPGRLIAYAASWFQDGAMVKLWDSSQWNIQFSFNKFNVPVCTNGQVILSTYDARILVFE